MGFITHSTKPKQMLKFVLMWTPRELSDPKGLTLVFSYPCDIRDDRKDAEVKMGRHSITKLLKYMEEIII